MLLDHAVAAKIDDSVGTPWHDGYKFGITQALEVLAQARVLRLTKDEAKAFGLSSRATK